MARWRLLGYLALVVGLAACAPSPPAAVNTPPAAVLAGEPARGRAYAGEACAQCHAIRPDRTMSPNPLAPSFVEIANTPGMTRLALTVWLNSEHPSMPHLIVAPGDADDLAAYIASLGSGG
jgi:mono/diheme cytochrome c family protein